MSILKSVRNYLSDIFAWRCFVYLLMAVLVIPVSTVLMWLYAVADVALMAASEMWDMAMAEYRLLRRMVRNDLDGRARGAGAD